MKLKICSWFLYLLTSVPIFRYSCSTSDVFTQFISHFNEICDTYRYSYFDLLNGHFDGDHNYIYTKRTACADENNVKTKKSFKTSKRAFRHRCCHQQERKDVFLIMKNIILHFLPLHCWTAVTTKYIIYFTNLYWLIFRSVATKQHILVFSHSSISVLLLFLAYCLHSTLRWHTYSKSPSFSNLGHLFTVCFFYYLLWYKTARISEFLNFLFPGLYLTVFYTVSYCFLYLLFALQHL